MFPSSSFQYLVVITSKSKLPTGVTLHSTGKYQALIGIKQDKKYLGLFVTPEEASIAYQTAKQARDRS